MRVALLGLGLIGGSIARAISLSERWPVAAWTPSGRGPGDALAAGTIALATSNAQAALEDADLVVLAAPPLECLALIDSLAGPWRRALAETATITDVASTKAAIVARADAAGLPFVGGHPMAGRETSGYGSSSADLFAGCPWIVVPGVHARPEDLERVERLASAVGARPVRMTAPAHDEAVAAISHLPLVVSAALVEAVAPSGGTAAGGPSEADTDAAMGAGEPDARASGPDPAVLARLAASGWRDTTRLALGDPRMGAGILATNAAPVRALLERYRASLDLWAADLERADGPDAAGLEARLTGARQRLEAMRATAADETTAPAPSGERVLVVPRASIVDDVGWRGVRPADLRHVLGVVERHGRFAPRADAERDPSLKQVIPYLVLRDGARVFLMHRTRAGGDPRLHDRWTIGVGGHLNPGDVDVAGGLRREWTEELAAGFVPEFRFVGLLNDDTTDVGSVHVGLVFEADAAGRAITVRETDKLSGAFVDLAAVRDVYDGLETWSQLILPSLEERVG